MRVGVRLDPHTGVASHLMAEHSGGKLTGRFQVHHVQAGASGLYHHAHQSFTVGSHEQAKQAFEGFHRAITQSHAAQNIATGKGGSTLHSKSPITFHPYDAMTAAGGQHQANARAARTQYQNTQQYRQERQRVAARGEAAFTEHQTKMAAAKAGPMPGSQSRRSFSAGPNSPAVIKPVLTTSGDAHVNRTAGLLYGAHHHETHEYVLAHADGQGRYHVQHWQSGPQGHMVLHSTKQFTDRTAALQHAANLTTKGMGGKVARQVAGGQHPEGLKGKIAGYRNVFSRQGTWQGVTHQQAEEQFNRMVKKSYIGIIRRVPQRRVMVIRKALFNKEDLRKRADEKRLEEFRRLIEPIKGQGLDAWWNPGTRKLWVSWGDWAEDEPYERVKEAAHRLFGKENVTMEAECSPKEADGWVRLKQERFRKAHTSARLIGIVKAADHKFSSTQVEVSPDVREILVQWAKIHIPVDDLADDGIEENPHITVKYGLHTDRVAEVRDALAKPLVTMMTPITAFLKDMSLFSTPEYDVLKYDVSSPDLEALNARLSTLPHTDTYPQYHPHLTVAYLKRGAGIKYAGEGPLTGTRLVFDELVFSSKSGRRRIIGLRGQPLAVDPVRRDDKVMPYMEVPAA